MKKLYVCLTVSLVVIVLFSTPLFSLNVNADSSAVIWSDKEDYFPDEAAHIFGYGFTPLSEVQVNVVRPDLNTDIIITYTDEFGYFECQYLLDGIHGVFNVTATEGNNIATTSFHNCLYLRVKWSSHCCWYIKAVASHLKPWKEYYVKYFDPAGVERRQSPLYSGVLSFTDNLTVTPSLPNILGRWTVKLYEGSVCRRIKYVYVDRMVWTTDSTYNTLVTSYSQGETVYFKAVGLKTNLYYRFMFETPSGNKIYVGEWTTGVETLTGSFTLPGDAETGDWKLHVREASDASGTFEHHYVDTCFFEVTSAPPPPKYYLTVNTEPENLVTIPGEGWYDACTYANLSAPELVPCSTNNMRYRFDYWEVDGVPQGAGVTDISIYMDADHTAIAHYMLQYYLNVTSNPAEVTEPAGEGWYDCNTTVSIFAPEYVGITPDASRYRFDGWVTEDMSEIADPSSVSTTVYLDKPKIVTANYVSQHKVTFKQTGLDDTATGTVVIVDSVEYGYTDLPYSIWADEGSTFTYSYQGVTSSSVTGKRFKLIDVSGPASPFTVTGPVTITGNYKVQYQVTFDQTGLDSSTTGTVVTVNGLPLDYDSLPFSQWIDEGASTTYSYENVVSSNLEGKQFKLSSVTGPASPFTVNAPVAITGNYLTQYYLTVTSPFGTPLGEGWYDAGATAYAGLDTGLVDHGNGTRRVFIYWSGDASGTNYSQSDPITIDAPKTATANWKTQYSVTFTQTGSAVAPTVTYTAETDPTETVPFTVWVSAGSQITFTYQDIVTGADPEVRYVLVEVNPSSPQTVNNPITVIATYQTQYYLTVETDPPSLVNIPGEGWYPSSENVLLSAPTVPGYDFLYWDVDGASQGSGVSAITVVMDGPHTATAHYAVAPSQYTLTISAETGGTTDPAPGTYTYDEGTIVSVTAIPEENYKFDHWELDGAYYSDQLTVEVTMDSDHELKAFFQYLPPLSVSVDPSSATIEVGESVTFTASVSGGVEPYSYQWYVNNEPVSGATSDVWTFTPTAAGVYYIHVVVTDSENQTVQSPASRVIVQESIPTVGGKVYPIIFNSEPKVSGSFLVALIITLAGAALATSILVKRRRKCK